MVVNEQAQRMRFALNSNSGNGLVAGACSLPWCALPAEPVQQDDNDHNGYLSRGLIEVGRYRAILGMCGTSDSVHFVHVASNL